MTRDLANALGHLLHASACLANQPGTAGHLLYGVLNQMPDLPRCLGGALCQAAHFRGHHGKTPPLLSCARCFHRRIEGEDIRLKGDAINHGNDLGHTVCAALNRFHRVHRLFHDTAALLHDLAQLGGVSVCRHSRLGIVLHHSGHLLHAHHGLRHIAGLQLGTLRQGLVILRECMPGLCHQCGIAANFRHHAGQRHHHAVQQTCHLALQSHGAGAASGVFLAGHVILKQANAAFMLFLHLECKFTHEAHERLY